MIKNEKNKKVMYNKYGEENDLYGNDKYSWIIFDVFR